MGDSAGAHALAENDEEPFLDAAWTEAIEATELLRMVLTDLGLADGFPRLRGDVNVYGRPMVTVGRIEPAAARRLAAVLSQAAAGREAVPRFGAETVRLAGSPTESPAPAVSASAWAAGPSAPVPAQVQVPVPTPAPAPMPAPRTYGGPSSTSASDDLQASALRVMRLYGGPAAPAQAADTRDTAAPESWAPMLAACAVPAQVPVQVQTGEVPGADLSRLPLRTDGASMDGTRGGGHRLPA